MNNNLFTLHILQHDYLGNVESDHIVAHYHDNVKMVFKYFDIPMGQNTEESKRRYKQLNNQIRREALRAKEVWLEGRCNQIKH